MNRLAALVLLASLPVCAHAASLRGVNLSGAELGAGNLPGRADIDYFYPNGVEIARWASLGMTALRLPVLWERLQPTLGGELDDAELSRLRAVIRLAASARITLIVDVHDYGAYRGTRVGEAAVTAEAFAVFWSRMAAALAGEAVAFGLMNEPNGIDSTHWAAIEQDAITAIRATGARNLILVSGTGWDGAHNFVSGDGYGTPNAVALATLRDPAGNFAIEMHQYFDTDRSGTHADCAAPADAVRLLQSATTWLRARRLHGFLGEFGVSRTKVCTAALDAVLGMLDAERDVWIGWTYWAAGRWWGTYMFSAEPTDGIEPPQLSILRRHLGSAR